MDKSLGTLLRFWGVFQFTQVQPLPSPHKQCWTRVSRIFFQVSSLDRIRGGRAARKCRKGCTVLRRNREMTEKYEYCNTVPRTFVQDCSSFLPFIFLFRLSSSSLIAVISSSRSRRNWKKHHNNKTRHPSLLRRDLTKKWRRRQRQKAISLVSKTTTLHMHHAFLYIVFAVPARLRREVTKF